MNRIIARMLQKNTRVAHRPMRRSFTRTALTRNNFDADLSDENWEAINNSDLIADACEQVMDGGFPKLTNQMVEGIKYAVDNNVRGKKFQYLVAYLTARKTADDVFYSTIKDYVDVYGPIDYANLLDMDSFVNLTAGGATRSMKGVLNKIGKSWNTDTLDEVMTIIYEYFNGQLTDYNTFKLVDMAYIYFAGADASHMELMRNWRKPKGLTDDLKHEIRDLIADNVSIERLNFITEYADFLTEGDPTFIATKYDGDIEALYKAVQTDSLDDVLYPGLVASKIQRMRRMAAMHTRRIKRF